MAPHSAAFSRRGRRTTKAECTSPTTACFQTTWAACEELRCFIHNAFELRTGILYQCRYFDRQALDDAMACFFATRGLKLPFVQGLEANIASVRQMTAQWAHYDEDLATVRQIINNGGDHVFAVRNLYSLALPLPLNEHVSASAAGAAFAAKAAQEYISSRGLSVQLDPLKSISSTDFGAKLSPSSHVHVCYM